MSTDLTDEIEYGRIVVCMKDGSEGSALSVTGDVKFGRDKSSDIRIKLASVSREHALVSVDQNGQVRAFGWEFSFGKKQKKLTYFNLLYLYVLLLYF